MDLDLEVTDHSGVAVVAVSGELDFSTAPQLREQLLNLTAAGHERIVVNLDPVAFIDSAGLGVLVGELKRLRGHGGDLILTCTQRRILTLLEITGLAKVFAVHRSIEAALESPGPATADPTPA